MFSHSRAMPACRLVFTSDFWQGLAFSDELHRDRIDAVPGVFVGEAFAEEDVAEVSVAVLADDFGTPAIGVGHATHAAFDLVVEARPTATRMELG